MEATDGIIPKVYHPLRQFFVRNYLGFEDEKFTSASFMLEGDEKSVEWKNNQLRKIAAKFGAFYSGEKVAQLSYTASSSYSIYMRVSKNSNFHNFLN